MRPAAPPRLRWPRGLLASLAISAISDISAISAMAALGSTALCASWLVAIRLARPLAASAFPQN